MKKIEIKDEERQELFYSELAKEVGTVLSLINNFDDEKNVKEFFMGLISEHRTIQQSFWAMIFSLIKLYGEEAQTDLRNESAKEWCKKVADFLGNEDYFGLPLI